MREVDRRNNKLNEAIVIRIMERSVCTRMFALEKKIDGEERGRINLFERKWASL